MHAGVLLLSHCGYSFMEKLARDLRQLDLRVYILSSRPEPGHEARQSVLSNLSDGCCVLDECQIEYEHIELMIEELHAQGAQILFCLSVWEGYRVLMARTNARLGCEDLAPETVEKVTDKFLLRQRLYNNGLSAVDSYLLSEQVLDKLRYSGDKYFIKPVKGIASYGTFPLTSSVNWSKLEALIQSAADDYVYAGYFCNQPKFMAEQYIEGTEYSFEIIAIRGRAYVITVHEKTEVTQSDQAVHENAVVSPPLSLSETSLRRALEWLSEIFKLNGLHVGCFHVEARFYKDRWEIIEINPRAGGCLIPESVEAITNYRPITFLWAAVMTYLATNDNTQMQTLIEKLQQFEEAVLMNKPCGSPVFFRAYFGKPGRIAKLELSEMARQPKIAQLFLKVGEKIEKAAREVFIGQIMWLLPQQDLSDTVQELLHDSRDAVLVEYVE